MTDVLLVRALGGDDTDADALRALGVCVVEDPYLSVDACSDADATHRAHSVLQAIGESADWLVVTSRAALRALAELASPSLLADAFARGRERGLSFAAVGESTASAMRDLGADAVLTPAQSTAAGLRTELVCRPAARVILPQGRQAMTGLAEGLRAVGWTVDQEVVYETATVSERPSSADGLARGAFDAVVLRSPTAVRAVASFVPVLAPGTVVVCGGPTTADEANRLGLPNIVVSPAPGAAAVAETVVRSTTTLDAM